MQYATHVALQGLVDHLMLLHAALAAKSFRYHLSRIMIAVAGKICLLYTSDAADE